MDWTTEQNAIFSEGLIGTGHLIVTARAGAAKTSTIVELAKRLPERSSGLFLAFNTKIRDEAKDRLPPNFHAMTLNGCGFNAWRRYIGKPCKVDKDKTYNIATSLISKLDKRDADQIWEHFGELRKAISMAKNCGYLPIPPSPAFRPLTSREDFYSTNLDFETDELERDFIDEVLRESWALTRQGVLDFDDMLLAPAVAGVGFDHYDYVMVDEAQDLAMINHVMLKKIVRGTTRLIAVGDPCQAIYGFRGADESSMENLQQLFSMKELFLTTSFRCSQAVCANASWRAPDMNSPAWAAPGSVTSLNSWNSDAIADGAAIICRNNAPLFSLAIELLRAGRYPELRGRDVIKTVVAKMRKLGKEKLTQEEALRSLAAWQAAEKLRQRDHKLLADQADCMRIFITETENLGQAIAFALGLANQAGRIYMMTGHGAKGLEFNDVFFLDQELLHLKTGQDKNVKYVIETRAKLNLTYLTTEGFSRETTLTQKMASPSEPPLLAGPTPPNAQQP